MQTSAPKLTDDEYSKAMTRAGHMLAAHPRTEKEVRDRLTAADFDDSVVNQAIERLTELKLIDDAAFARNWIEERARTKNLASRALLQELVAKGIELGVAEVALAEAEVDEHGQARKLAARHLAKVEGLPLAKQAVRIQQLLLRRGYDLETAVGATRSVLPPEGWD